MPWKYLCKTSWRRFRDVLKTSSKRLEDVLARRLEDVLKTSWRRLLKTKTKDVFKTSSSRRMFAGLTNKAQRLFKFKIKLTSANIPIFVLFIKYKQIRCFRWRINFLYQIILNINNIVSIKLFIIHRKKLWVVSFKHWPQGLFQHNYQTHYSILKHFLMLLYICYSNLHIFFCKQNYATNIVLLETYTMFYIKSILSADSCSPCILSTYGRHLSSKKRLYFLNL